MKRGNWLVKLLKLIADKKSFHPIVFKDGINVIVGKKTTADKKVDGNTFNGVGKSLIVHLIHFCLCSNKIDTLEEKLPNWTFTLFYARILPQRQNSFITICAAARGRMEY